MPSSSSSFNCLAIPSSVDWPISLSSICILLFADILWFVSILRIFICLSPKEEREEEVWEDDETDERSTWTGMDWKEGEWPWEWECTREEEEEGGLEREREFFLVEWKLFDNDVDKEEEEEEEECRLLLWIDLFIDCNEEVEEIEESEDDEDDNEVRFVEDVEDREEDEQEDREDEGKVKPKWDACLRARFEPEE